MTRYKARKLAHFWDSMKNYSSLLLVQKWVNLSITNHIRKDADIRQQSKATSPVVPLKYYDPPVATATILFYIWFVSMTLHHLLVTSVFVRSPRVDNETRPNAVPTYLRWHIPWETNHRLLLAQEVTTCVDWSSYEPWYPRGT